MVNVGHDLNRKVGSISSYVPKTGKMKKNGSDPIWTGLQLKVEAKLVPKYYINGSENDQISFWGP